MLNTFRRPELDGGVKGKAFPHLQQRKNPLGHLIPLQKNGSPHLLASPWSLMKDVLRSASNNSSPIEAAC